jgi:hypothetical protein
LVQTIHLLRFDRGTLHLCDYAIIGLMHLNCLLFFGLRAHFLHVGKAFRDCAKFEYVAFQALRERLTTLIVCVFIPRKQIGRLMAEESLVLRSEFKLPVDYLLILIRACVWLELLVV